jgi:hypothetical protein
MTLRQWIHERKIDHDKVLALSVASDGFKISRDNIMSVSATGNWPNADMGTAFIAGADAEKVREYTEVDPKDYKECAIPLEDAYAKVLALVEQADFTVIFYASYAKKWFKEFLPKVLDTPTLDLVSVCKALEQNMELPVDIEDIAGLDQRLAKASFHVKGGYSLDGVCARMIPGVDGDTADAYLTGNTPKLERQVYRLYSLYHALLDR